MASMRDIKRRKESVASTGQITKAMKLVSTVKLQKAKARAESNKPYFTMLYDTICSILARTGTIDHRYLRESDSKRKAVIAITSNRGLAGGYNNNIVKEITAAFAPEDTDIYAVGKKGLEGLSRKGYHIIEDYSEVMNEPLYADAIHIGKNVLASYENGEVGEIYLAYTGFKNTVVHEPKLIKLLPISVEEIMKDVEIDTLTLMNFEPEADEALDMIIPKYMNNIIYGAFVEAIASENGARMQAMDSATKNAEDMIDDLSLKYNRARQSSITQELTEIIAGAEAIS
ncbi:MAG TPA: ATP synthase F1 subunit gamma [Lachnospiraceae bacterium]|nr:ATP synthase F1 subunit gamma [Lachnospiraceae bacterium]